MPSDVFNTQAFQEKAAADLAALEVAARRDLLAKIAEDDLPRQGLRDQVISALENYGAPRRANAAALVFSAEPVLPVAALHLDQGFSELLLRLQTRDGKTMSPYGLIKEISTANVFAGEISTSTEPYAGWSPWFRRWLAIAQIDSVKGRPGERFSVNITPQDMALDSFDEKGQQDWSEFGYPDFPTDLRRAVTLCGQTGTPPLVLEATEDWHWQNGRADLLADIARATGATVAVDDYGSDSSFNHAHHLPQTAATLKSFAALMPANRLLVKMDGKIVKHQPEALEKYLTEVRSLAPGAGVVLEWVGSNTRALLDGLSPESRAMVVAAQDRDFDKYNSPQEFFNSLAGPQEKAGPADPPAP